MKPSKLRLFSVCVATIIRFPAFISRAAEEATAVGERADVAARHVEELNPAVAVGCGRVAVEYSPRLERRRKTGGTVSLQTADVAR